ncbi:MAG: hypothetical protein ACPGEF_03955, partial [Endozoicomonas sp.]
AEYFKRQDMWPNVQEHIISFRGLRIGMEICADHGLLKSYPKVTKNINAQLLVSCGKPTGKYNICTIPNGTFMRVDGYHGKGLRWELRHVVGYKNDSMKEFDRWDKTSYGELDPTTLALATGIPDPHLEHEIPFVEGHPLYWTPPKDTVMSDWKSYKQGITFFEPQEI